MNPSQPESSTTQKPLGTVITFYSFKGGVGRSMALANIAVLLARAGKRVLCIDWDLEAPGLDRYFRALPRSSPRGIPSLSEPKAVGGLLAILDGSTKDRLVPWSDFVRTRVGPDGVKVDFLSSGEDDPNYSAQLSKFSWTVFFAKRSGGDIIEALRHEWKKDYDFILVDSRTGLTDLSGICTIQMPDLVVLLFAANQQNIQWCERVAHGIRKGRRALPYDRRFLTIIPVLSRFDAREESDLAAEALNRIASVFAPFFSDWLPKSIAARDMLASSALPYMPRYSFDEALAVEDEPAIGAQGLSFNYHLLSRLILARLQGVRAILAGVGVPGAALPPLLPSISELREELRNKPRIAERYTKAFKARSEEEPLEAAEAFETLATACAGVLPPADAVQLLQGAIDVLNGPAVAKVDEIPRLLGKQAELLAQAGRMSEAEKRHRAAVASSTEAFGEQDPRTIEALENLRRFLENMEPKVEAASQLPAPPDAFTGRVEELSYLESLVAARGNIGAAISASGAGAGIHGMGGVGKTALATVLAHRLKTRYPDAQICLNLRGFDPMGGKPMPPAEAMQRIIHFFQPEAKLPVTLQELTPIYNSVLNDAGRVLLFLDNAGNAEQIQPLLPPSNCLLLVTSRNQISLPGLATQNIDCLPPEKSRELLLKLSPRIKGHEAIAADLCGHLPLALEVFAGVVSEKRLHPVEELVARLRKQDEKLGTVVATFQVSYDLLEQSLRRCWSLLGIFPAGFDLPAAASIWERKMEASRDIMEALLNASLVETDEAKRRFRVHDLVRQFCNGKLGDAERDAAMMRYARHYAKVGDEADELYLKGGENVLRGLELFDRERNHIEAAYEWLAPKRDEACAALLISLVDAVVYTGQGLRFHPRQSIRWLESQCDAARITKNREAEGWALCNLGIAHLALGESRKAIEFHEKALVIDREVGNRLAEGQVLGNLGLAYAALGEPRKAIEFYEQRLVIAREIGDRRGEGNALGNLGNAFFVLGEPRKAIEFHEQQLAITREIGDRRGEDIALGNLGNAYSDLGEARKAIEFYEKALVVDREIGDRRGEAQDLGNLGLAYADLEQPREAIEFFEQQLVITREIGDRRGEGSALWNSALALDILGDRAKAIARAEAALKICEAIESPHAAKVRAKIEEWRGGGGKAEG
jgi:tetratricopeptide (TPR) repeat protein